MFPIRETTKPATSIYVAKLYLEMKRCLPSSGQPQGLSLEGLSDKARSWMVDILDSSLRAGCKCEEHQGYPLQSNGKKDASVHAITQTMFRTITTDTESSGIASATKTGVPVSTVLQTLFGTMIYKSWKKFWDLISHKCSVYRLRVACTSGYPSLGVPAAMVRFTPLVQHCAAAAPSVLSPAATQCRRCRPSIMLLLILHVGEGLQKLGVFRSATPEIELLSLSAAQLSFCHASEFPSKLQRQSRSFCYSVQHKATNASGRKISKMHVARKTWTALLNFSWSSRKTL